MKCLSSFLPATGCITRKIRCPFSYIISRLITILTARPYLLACHTMQYIGTILTPLSDEGQWNFNCTLRTSNFQKFCLDRCMYAQHPLWWRVSGTSYGSRISSIPGSLPWKRVCMHHSMVMIPGKGEGSQTHTLFLLVSLCGSCHNMLLI